MTTGDKTRIKKIRTDGWLTEDFTYDGQARVSEYKQTVDNQESYPMVTGYLYDTLDRVTEVHYPAQYGLAGNPRKVVAQAYDTASRLTQMTYGGDVQASGMVYNAAGQTAEIKIGESGTNQVTEEYTFDPQTGLLTNQKAVRNSIELMDLSYGYSRLSSVGSLNGKTGHLTSITDNIDTNRNRQYEFDALGRLTKAVGGKSATWDQTYTYDRYGNRTNVTATGTAADSSPIPIDGIPGLSYDNTNNRITTTGYEYDAAGNQIRALAENGVDWLLYVYDAANRLKLVSVDGTTPVDKEAYYYGASNSRLLTHNLVSGAMITYASGGGTTLAEYTDFPSAPKAWTKSYTYLGSTQLATITPNGLGSEYVEFNHPDRLGTRLQTNQGGGTSYEQVTLPFGTALNAESTATTNNKRFTSYDRSATTGLDYAVNRTYDSKQGRFTQVDPIGMSAVSFAAPQTLNMYTYCGNDPINYTDPSGLFFGKLFKWIGKIIKWVMLAVTIAALILTVVGTVFGPLALAAFSKTLLGGVLNFIAGIPGMIGSSMFAGTGASIAGALSLTEKTISIVTGMINAGLGMGVLAAAKAAVGAISNSLAEKSKPGPKTRAFCRQIEPYINAARDLFNDAFRNSIGVNSVAEQGGLVQWDAGGKGEAFIYERIPDTPSNSLVGFKEWAAAKSNNLRNGNKAIVRLTYHTHVYEEGDFIQWEKGDALFAKNPNFPSGGDRTVSKELGMPGVIISSTSIVVYGPQGRRCRFDR